VLEIQEVSLYFREVSLYLQTVFFLQAVCHS
jgi:hypothetical protein